MTDPDPVIDVVRLHAYRSGIFQIFDVPKEKYEERKQNLIAEGYVITHVEFV